jgi:hypothetical protein
VNKLENIKVPQVKETPTKVIYPELSYQIMSIVFDVHNQLGPGFTEDIYEKAIIYELQARQIRFEAQKNRCLL